MLDVEEKEIGSLPPPGLGLLGKVGRCSGSRVQPLPSPATWGQERRQWVISIATRCILNLYRANCVEHCALAGVDGLRKLVGGRGRVGGRRG